MKNQDYNITEEELQRYQQRGYNEDLLPKPLSKRMMGTFNYFTLWMGSVHNIPNYAAVGGFLFLGLSPINSMIALVISALAVALFMTFNGRAGSKYGIPFAMHLRATYGDVGAKLPGFLRGCVAAIAWFGLQNYTGSLALLILIGKIWPGFLKVGGNIEILGISIPGLIAFSTFWLVNMLIGLGGGKILNKFTAILSPLIYIVFGGMAIWALKAAGGIGPILSYNVSGAAHSISPVLVYFMIISSVLSVWAAPGASVSDFTQNAKSTRAQTIGQTASLLVGYGIFAFSSVVILIGGSIHYGIQEWNILNIVERWENSFAIIIAMLVFLLTTVSTNATGNIIPAAYQLCALFPKKINYKKGVLIASVISFLIMPWKLMEDSASIYLFLNTIGAVLGPVAGTMIAHYYFVQKQTIHLDQLFLDQKVNNQNNLYKGVNKPAYIATIMALVICLSGNLIPALRVISDISWLAGFGSAFCLYLLLKKTLEKKQTGEVVEDE